MISQVVMVMSSNSMHNKTQTHYSQLELQSLIITDKKRYCCKFLYLYRFACEEEKEERVNLSSPVVKKIRANTTECGCAVLSHLVWSQFVLHREQVQAYPPIAAADSTM